MLKKCIKHHYKCARQGEMWGLKARVNQKDKGLNKVEFCIYDKLDIYDIS
jgi:hypothetical protein